MVRPLSFLAMKVCPVAPPQRMMAEMIGMFTTLKSNVIKVKVKSTKSLEMA
jgi:hypothetical protein